MLKFKQSLNLFWDYFAQTHQIIVYRKSQIVNRKSYIVIISVWEYLIF